MLPFKPFGLGFESQYIYIQADTGAMGWQLILQSNYTKVLSDVITLWHLEDSNEEVVLMLLVIWWDPQLLVRTKNG